jgi:hypothetical protein
MFERLNRQQPEVIVEERLSIEDVREDIRGRREKLRAAQEGKIDYKDDHHLLEVTNEELGLINEQDAALLERIRGSSTKEEIQSLRKDIDEFVAQGDSTRPNVDAVIVSEFATKWTHLTDPRPEGIDKKAV